MKNLLRTAFTFIAPLCLVLPAAAMTASQKVEVERQIKQNDGSVQIVIAYIEGSADIESANVLYSVDNGATFKTRDSLQVNLPSGDTRLAAASEITHIRWILIESLKPGDQGEIKFKGRLK